MRLGLTSPASPSNHSSMGTGASSPSGLTIDWARYETMKKSLGLAQNELAAIKVQLSQVQMTLATRSMALDTTRKQLEESRAAEKLLKDELMRTGVTLKALAQENFEIKNVMKDREAQGKK